MILKSFGCSFIAGHELSDFAPDSPSQLTYPALLAKHFGMRYQCHAEATSGNLRILHRVIDELENDTSANFYLIQWSFANRYDLTLTADNQNHSWKSILPSDRNDMTTAYYKYIHSEYRDILLSLMHWSTALQALQNSPHKFLMIAVDDTLTLSKWQLDPVMQHFRYRLNDYIKKFDGRPWFDWCVDNAWPMGMAKHPLEQAHYQTFQHILGKNWFQTAKS